MFCGKCGSENNSTSNFCVACGDKLIKDVETSAVVETVQSPNDDSMSLNKIGFGTVICGAAIIAMKQPLSSLIFGNRYMPSVSTVQGTGFFILIAGALILAKHYLSKK